MSSINKKFVLNLAVIALSSMYQPIHACSYSPGIDMTPATIGERTENSSHVIIGAIANSPNKSEKNSALIHVERWIKGTGPKSMQVSYAASNCATQPPEQRSIIFINLRENDGTYEISDFAFWAGVADVTAENVEQIKTTIEVGLRAYLISLGDRIEMVGQVDKDSEAFVLLKLSTGDVVRVRAGDAVRGWNFSVVEFSETFVRIEMHQSTMDEKVYVDIQLDGRPVEKEESG